MAFEGLTVAACATSSLAVVGGLSLVLSNTLQHKLLPSIAESSLKDKLPFDHMAADQMTIVCKNGALCRVIELQGLHPDSLTQDMLTALFHKRLNWLQALSDEGLSLKMLTVRDEVAQPLSAEYAEPLLQTLHERWQQPFSQTYHNRHYLIVTEHPQQHDWSVRLKARLSGETLAANAPLGRLELTTEMIRDYLHDYQPRLLSHEGTTSPLLSFWASVINGRLTTVGLFNHHLSEQLVNNDLVFDVNNKRIRWQGAGAELPSSIGAILTLNHWGPEARTSLMQQLTTIAGRFVMLQQVKGWPKAKSLLHLTDQLKQRTLLGDLAPQTKLVEEFEAAIKVIGDDEARLMTYQWSMLLLADDEETLATNISQVQRIFKDNGYLAVLEGGCLEYAWSSFLPGTRQFKGKGQEVTEIETFLRPSTILSANVASLMVFPREPVGLTSCDWGEGALRLFPTASGGAYHLQLHESADKEALAHTLVVAPAGSGKTTLFQHLIGGALRHHNLRAYIFDRFQGTRIFTDSVGGSPIDLSGRGDQRPCLNPLLGDDSPEERAFLVRFLSLLSGHNTAAAKAECRRAVSLLQALPRERRVLSELSFQLFSRHGEVLADLAPWIGQGERAAWFNGARAGQAFDALSLEASRLVSFDITSITEEDSPPEETAAVMSYLLHRIRRVIREQALPHMIFIDETAPMLKNELFKRIVGVLLKEHCKLRGSISLCFQDMSDLMKSGMASVIIKQCPTQFLFPNSKASREEYALFNLTDAEWAYIKGETPVARRLKHSVLVKKSPAGGQGESVILNCDMSPLGPYLKLYRSGSEPVKLVQDLQQQWGSGWIDTYVHAA